MGMVSSTQKLLLGILLGWTALPAQASTCEELLQNFDPSKFLPRSIVKTDGTGIWLPPIGSKLFIAWRNRTPPHIPDSAYFNYWLNARDVQQTMLESNIPPSKRFKIGTKNIAYPRELQSLEDLIRERIRHLKVSGSSQFSEYSIDIKSLWFVDRKGEPFLLMLGSKCGHNATAQAVLDKNPDLYLLGTENFSVTFAFDEAQRVSLVRLNQPGYTSPTLKEEVLALMAPRNLHFENRIVQTKALFATLPEELLSETLEIKNAQALAPPPQVRHFNWHSLK
jgi:hypothetical protein